MMGSQDYQETLGQKETRGLLEIRANQDGQDNRECWGQQGNQGVTENLENWDPQVRMAAQEDLEVRAREA